MSNASRKKFGDTGNFDGYMVDPDAVTIAEDDPSHPHYERHAARRAIKRWLVDSIKRKGVIVPIIVYLDGTIPTAAAGRRRLRHARIAKAELIADGREKPFLIRAINTDDPATARILENRHRLRESPMVDAHDIGDMMATGVSLDAAAAELGVTKRRAADLVLLLKADPVIQAKVDARTMPVDVAVRLAKKPSAEQRAKVAAIETTGEAPADTRRAQQAVAKPRPMPRKVVEAFTKDAALSAETEEAIRLVLGLVKIADVRSADLRAAYLRATERGT